MSPNSLPTTPAPLPPTREALAILKRKAEAATPGEWQHHALLLEPADLAQLAKHNDQAAVGLRIDMPSGPRRVVALCGPLDDKPSRATAVFIAAANPAAILSLLAALDAQTAQVLHSNTLLARLTKDALAWISRAVQAEAALAARTAELQQARAELDAVEPERLRLIQELIRAQSGHTTDLLTAEVLTDKYGLPAIECPECAEPVSLAGHFGCPCALTPPAPAGPGEAGGAAVAGVAQVCARCGQQCDADCENDGRWYDGPLVECPCCKGEGARLMRCDACENTGKVPAASLAAAPVPAAAPVAGAGGEGGVSGE